ncbi:DUF4142 domain-containing protein [Dactylosporangium sp. NPDC051485]|uniref:DUF4142 domain-containing protein n=1 Tax=Dactylosporangium sp. NPDC051485 TaxID=3154846 RepID=UPI00342FFA4A
MRAIFATSIAAAVCAAVASLPAAAHGAATPAPPVPPVPVPQGPSPTGQAPPGTQLSAQDRTFLTQAAQAAQFEVTTGRLAGDRAASTAVRSFGQRMVTDHGKELQQLQSLDQTLGIASSPAPDADQQNLTAIWTTVQGGAFDCSYAPAIYALHAHDVQAFDDVAAHADNPQVRQFAAGQLPVMRQHLQMASKNLHNLNCSAPAPSGVPS